MLSCDCDKVVSSVSAYNQKLATINAKFQAESPGPGERPPHSVLPTDMLLIDPPVSKLPGDQYPRRLMAFQMFGSMREMLAAA